MEHNQYVPLTIKTCCNLYKEKGTIKTFNLHPLVWLMSMSSLFLFFDDEEPPHGMGQWDHPGGAMPSLHYDFSLLCH